MTCFDSSFLFRKLTFATSTLEIQVNVRVPSLNRAFPGKVVRFSVDVRSDTRTMHTEVDVLNPQRVLVPGLYAEAELQFDRKDNIPSVPVQALIREGDKASVLVVNA